MPVILPPKPMRNIQLGHKMIVISLRSNLKIKSIKGKIKPKNNAT